MKKKLVSVLLSVAIVATLLAGCGSSSKEATTDTTTTTEATTDTAAVEEPAATDTTATDTTATDTTTDATAATAEEVPAATYEYSFDNDLGGAVVATRVGDNEDGGNAGTLPAADATITPIYEEGVSGQALTFDSTYGLILDNAAAVGEDYTISFWVKAERFSNYGPILQLGSDLLSASTSAKWLNITKTDWDGDMAPVVWSRNEVDATWPWFACGTGFVMPKQEWVHVAVSVMGSTPVTDPADGLNYATGKVYVNGALMGTGNVALGTFTGDAKVYVGINCWDILFKGAIDELKIYNTVLTDGQIVTLATK